jgi:SpoVK/Ycf46/Vps4 family AAA+-type ATPase
MFFRGLLWGLGSSAGHAMARNPRALRGFLLALAAIVGGAWLAWSAYKFGVESSPRIGVALAESVPAAQVKSTPERTAPVKQSSRRKTAAARAEQERVKVEQAAVNAQQQSAGQQEGKVKYRAIHLMQLLAGLLVIGWSMASLRTHRREVVFMGRVIALMSLACMGGLFAMYKGWMPGTVLLTGENLQAELLKALALAFVASMLIPFRKAQAPALVRSVATPPVPPQYVQQSKTPNNSPRQRPNLPLQGNAPASGGEAEEKPAEFQIPRYTFKDVGGMEAEKEEVRKLIMPKLEPGKYQKYKINSGGLLLFGPQGSGKTFFAEAVAGEFKLNFIHARSTESSHKVSIGTAEAWISKKFAMAAGVVPCLLFVDELDSIAGKRQNTEGDGGGARQHYNNVTNQLLLSIDRYRSVPGLVLVAATNHPDLLDGAVTRDGRFDYKLRVDYPDQKGREIILRQALSDRPNQAEKISEICAAIPQYSPAKIVSLVDRAAFAAAEQNKPILDEHLYQALREKGGKDRPNFNTLEWNQVILESQTMDELHELVDLLNVAVSGDKSGPFECTPPAGLILAGPPGTGKTMVARLIATQAHRSFYPVKPDDILSGAMGGSVKRMQELFSRARENAPSVIYFDEMDGLFRRDATHSHDVQLVEQTLTEISNLTPENRVFLIGTTNRLDTIDPRMIRGGRFSEKIEIGLPSKPNRIKLFQLYLGGAPLDSQTSFEQIAGLREDLSPADIEAICEASKRAGALRVKRASGQGSAALCVADFARAMERVKGAGHSGNYLRR